MPQSSSAFHVPPARAQRILEQRTRDLAERGQVVAERPLPPMLICALGEELCGLSLEDVARVVPDGPCAPLPGAPPALLGLMGARGQAFLLLDLALALGRGQPARPGGHVLLLRHAAPRFAIRVDRVTGVQAPQSLPPDPHAGPGPLSGHALLPSAAPRPVLLGLIDTARLLHPFLPAAQTLGA
ncbi:chemotaxis protein CheW [Teichococcus oryzae]|uniref:Chemotaxis protein CheW n=1 Tax=Teichococcus oryzae TaxID=1608942 RepID=A0A5B2TD51_9PROT|nr:chemotaxis protein CheW [Pseudoroseomonas oryzae]KAA2212079.1 chemotaxis protein CheW [Pseudoroseomonas oryzae]